MYRRLLTLNVAMAWRSLEGASSYRHQRLPPYAATLLNGVNMLARTAAGVALYLTSILQRRMAR